MRPIEIHEFSTGIIPERTDDGGWISRGFTGQYMNVTCEIPPEVERSIANKEFAVAEGAFSDRPTLIGREISGHSGVWSVIAVVTRGKDEKGRSASLYRYFLTQAPKGLESILAWIKKEARSGRSTTFDPFAHKELHHPNRSIEEPQPISSMSPGSLFSSTPWITEPEQDYEPESINLFARSKARENQELTAWAFNVEALEKPRRFQVIHPASDLAIRRIKQALTSAPIAATTSLIDEQAIKSAIKSLINASQVKPDAVQVLESSLSSVETVFKENESETFWHEIFDGQGAINAQKQQIYSPQMIRLMTLRAVMLPATVSDYLKWLQPDSGKKANEPCETAVSFQSQIARSVRPNSRLEAELKHGINQTLESVFHKSVSVESATWLLDSSNGLWSTVMPQMVGALHQFLASVRSTPATEKSVYPFKGRTWQHIESRLRMPVPATSKGDPKFLAIAELFLNLKDPAIAACFYQAARGLVPPDVYAEARGTIAFKNGSVFGIPLRREKSAVDRFLDFIGHPLTIGMMFALCLVAIGAIAFRYFETSRNQAEEAQRTRRSQVQPSPDPPITGLLEDTSLPETSPTSEDFQETRRVLQSIVQEVSKDPKIVSVIKTSVSPDPVQVKETVIEALESSLLDRDISERERKALNYQGIIAKNPSPGFPEAESQRKRWIALIHSYQLRSPQLKPAGFIKEGRETSNKLKEDVRKRIMEMSPQNQTPAPESNLQSTPPAILDMPSQSNNKPN